MTLICGLGNPGKALQKTRHNLGFIIVDHFAKKKKFLKFRISRKFHSLISEKILDGEKIVLTKPQTFMNNSGKAVKRLIENCKLKIENLIVVHDDVDLSLGEIRIVKNRGAAGHKGVQSIIDKLGTKNFVRFRIGIKPESYILNPKSLDNFVLEKFNKEEKDTLKVVIEKTVEAIEMILREGLEKTMNKFNK